MGPKYEFTDKTINHDGHILHRIKRFSDGKLGGWIESEENLSQYRTCWVDGNAKVYGDAKVHEHAQVYDDAQVYGNAEVCGNAQVYNNAQVYDSTRVYGHAQVYNRAYVYEHAQAYGNVKVFDDAQVSGNVHVYDNAQVYGYTYVFDFAKVYGSAQVYGDAQVYGRAEVYGCAEVYGYAQVYGYAKISKDDFYAGKHYDKSTINVENEESEFIKAFIYKISMSLKLDIRTNYDSVDAFFQDNRNDSYIEHECLTIITVDTKLPILKLEKAQVKNKNIFKFIVDITNEDDDYRVRSIIDSKEKFKQLLQSTINALKEYPQFNQYADALENCL